MTTKMKPAEQFAAAGIEQKDWTPAMRLAVKQKWSGLPMEETVAVLRERLAAVKAPEVPSVEKIAAELVAGGADKVRAQIDAEAEHGRLKRNAAVTRWRARNQLQAALDARELKYARLRSARKAPAAKAPAAKAPVGV